MLTTKISEPITIEALLRIPEDEPERLFSQTGLKLEYRTLAGRWYVEARTDPAASEAVGHLNALYKRAKRKIDAGTWEQPNTRILERAGGKRIEFRFRKTFAFELGDVLVGDHLIAYLIDPAHRDLFEHAQSAIASFAYADLAMKTAIEPYLPRIDDAFESAGTAGRPPALVLTIHKTRDLVCLADVLPYYGGRLDPKHVAWVLSSLHHLGCWLQWSNQHHNDISIANVFISPASHSVALLGGWWYATRGDEALRALPARTVNIMPSDVLRTKTSDARIDQDLIRALGRELLGNARGAHANGTRDPLDSWLRTASAGDATDDYAQWERVRTKTFGERRFIPMRLTADHLYSNV